MLELIGRKNDAPGGDTLAAASGVGRMFPAGGDGPLPLRGRRRRRKLDGTARSFHDALMEDLGQKDFSEDLHPRDDHGKFTDSGETSGAASLNNFIDENPSWEHDAPPVGVSFFVPGRDTFVAPRTWGSGDNRDFSMIGSHDQLARELGLNGGNAALDAGLVRTRYVKMNEELDLEGTKFPQIEQAILAAQKGGLPSDTRVYWNSRQGNGRANLAEYRLGRDESKLGEYGRAVAVGGMYDPEGPGGYASKAWHWLLHLVGRKDNPNHDELGRFASGENVAGGALELTGGATGRLIQALRARGGFTYSTFLKATPKTGKVLSIHPEREKVVKGKVTAEMLKTYHDANKDLLQERGNYLGCWKDKGSTYLDISAIVSTHAEAVKLGNEHGQKAYWDLDTGTEVRLDAGQKGRRWPAFRRASKEPDRRGLPADGRLPQWRGRVSDEAGRKAVDRLQQQARVRSILYDQKLWDELRAHATRAAMPIFHELYMGGIEAALRLAKHRGHKDVGPLDQQLAQQAEIDKVRLVNEWWSNIVESTRNQLADLLAPAAEAEGVLDLGAVIDGVAELFGSARAELIAVTETTRIMGDAAMATYNILGVSEWEWRTAEDSRVDEICDAMADGGPYSMDEPFEIAHIRCVLPGTICAEATVLAATARWYEGEVIVLRTAAGNELSVTPNHPILTLGGWCTAAELREGDDIIAQIPERMTPLIDPNNVEIPACVEQIPSALAKLFGSFTLSMPTSTENFHGDGMRDGEVDVVTAACLLGNNGNVMRADELRELQLIGCQSGGALTGDRISLSLGISLDSPFTSDMGAGILLDTRFADHSRPFHTLGIASPASLHSGFEETAADRPAIHIEVLGDGVLRLTGFVAKDDRGGVEWLSVVGRPSRLVAVESVRYSGHVYNLQTKSGYYGANGIISGNCRCWPVPVPPGEKEWREKEAAHTGAMVALFPPPTLAKKLAIEGGEPADELHVTLAFLGDAKDVDGESVIAAVKKVAANFAPISGEFSGIGRFSIPDGDAFYASADLPDIMPFRQAIVDALTEAKVKVADNHGFTAHCTLAYLDENDAAPLDRLEPQPVMFDSVVVALGGERTHIMLGGTKDWSEDLHPRDEHGRFANSDAGADMPLSHGSPYHGPPPGSPGALAAAKEAYAWVGDPNAVPSVSPFAGAKTVVDTPEIIAMREMTPEQREITITDDQATKYAEELKAEQDAGIKQERQAYIVLGVPASAKSSILADPLAEQYGARLADSDIAKSIIAEDLKLTEGRVTGADGWAGAVHEASSKVANQYIEDAMARGDNLVIPKVGDNYEKMAGQIADLKAAGYTVNLSLVDVKPIEEGMRRNVARYYSTGRFVDPLNTLTRTDSKPIATYERLKGEVDGYSRWDNSGLPGTRRLIEGTDPFGSGGMGSKGTRAFEAAQGAPLAGLYGGRQAAGYDVRGLKDNPNHDELGRFASGDEGSGVSNNGKFTKAQTEAVRFYQSSTYNDVNGVLRGLITTPDVVKYVDHEVKMLDAAIAHGTTDREIITYRGSSAVSLDPKTPVGSIVTDRAYVSTSQRPDLAEKFASWSEEARIGAKGIIAEITIPAGTHALETTSVPNAIMNDEKEVLLPRGTKFEVTGHHTSPDGRAVVKMKVIT